MSEGTGTVEFRGDHNTVCAEAADYTVTDNEGNDQQFVDVIQPGYKISGIPAEEVVRWVANPKFVAVDEVAEEVAEAFYKDVAVRINGTLIDEAEAEAASKSLEDMDKAELVVVAEEVGAEYSGRSTKAELVEAIKAKQAEGSEGDPNETGEGHGAPPSFGTIGQVNAGTGEEGEGS